MDRPLALRFRLLLAALIAVALMVHVAPAAAQTITDLTLPARANPRPTAQLPLWVNYRDCVANDVLQFSATLSEADGVRNLQVWAGTGECTTVEKRTEGNSCWLVYSQAPSSTVPDIGIRARDIVARNTPGNGSGTGSSGPGSGTREDCDESFEHQALTLTFMFTDGGDEAVGAVTFPGPLTGSTFGVDVTAPAPPTSIGVDSGENRLHLEWTPSTGDLLGYNFYCDPAPGALPDDAGLSTATAAQVLDASADSADGAPDSSSTGGAGGAPSGAGGARASATDGGDAGTTNCTGRDNLQPGAQPSSAYACGSATGKSATSGIARGLTNGQSYGVAIAAVDSVGNVGKLSEVSCGIPVLVTDFYEYYRDLNGGGGGGFCTASTGRQVSPTAAAISLSLLGLLLLRRRARRS